MRVLPSAVDTQFGESLRPGCCPTEIMPLGSGKPERRQYVAQLQRAIAESRGQVGIETVPGLFVSEGLKSDE